MLAARIIPTMLMNGRQLVKGKQFDAWRSIGHVVQAARIHAVRGVDELCMLDITATKEGRGPDFDLVAELSQWCFTPLTVGGGVRSIGDIERLLRRGADKVCIGTMLQDMDFIQEATARFGSQAIVGAIDYDRNGVMVAGGPVMMACDDGDTPMHPVSWSAHLENLGVGEIILTCMDREGMMDGYDLAIIEAVTKNVSIPVIAHGGCGEPAHALDAVRAGASAAGIGAMFAFTDYTPRDVAHYFDQHGVEARIE